MGKDLETTFDLRDTSRCFRVLVASGDEISDLEVAAKAPNGEVLGRDQLEAPIVVLGPLCASVPGTYRVLIVPNGRPGRVAARVLQAE